MVQGNHWDQWFSDGFGVRQPLVTMVFDGCAPLVRRWNGYVPSSKSRDKSYLRYSIAKILGPVGCKIRWFKRASFWRGANFGWCEEPLKSRFTQVQMSIVRDRLPIGIIRIFSTIKNKLLLFFIKFTTCTLPSICKMQLDWLMQLTVYLLQLASNPRRRKLVWLVDALQGTKGVYNAINIGWLCKSAIN